MRHDTHLRQRLRRARWSAGQKYDLLNSYHGLSIVLIMLKQIFFWCTSRLNAATRENERKTVVGQCAAHAMVLHLCGAQITRLDASGSAFGDVPDRCLLGASAAIEGMRYTALAKAAERMFVLVGDELLRGRSVGGRRISDKSLIGFCDGKGNILDFEAQIIGQAKQAYDAHLAGDGPVEQKVFFIDIVAKRIIAHFYLAIVNLAQTLLKRPLVTGEQECRQLIRECLNRAPANSLKLYCACHTDPMKPAFDKVLAGRGFGAT